MPDKFTALTPELHAYLVAHSPLASDPVLERLAQETDELGDIAVMQSAPEQVALLALLCGAIGARRALELGTFTGYSAIAIARALGEEGTLVACDVSEEWTGIARRYFEEAGVADRIDLRIAPALETLAELRGGEPFDFAFIDADKASYPEYWEAVVELIRANGLVVIDNVLSSGAVVLDPAEQAASPRAESIAAIVRTNELVTADERVESVMLGVADGITIARRRSGSG
jgi:caffeoyl-CoA O-methyltransferase